MSMRTLEIENNAETRRWAGEWAERIFDDCKARFGEEAHPVLLMAAALICSAYADAAEYRLPFIMKVVGTVAEEFYKDVKEAQAKDDAEAGHESEPVPQG